MASLMRLIAVEPPDRSPLTILDPPFLHAQDFRDRIACAPEGQVTSSPNEVENGVGVEFHRFIARNETMKFDSDPIFLQTNA